MNNNNLEINIKDGRTLKIKMQRLNNSIVFKYAIDDSKFMQFAIIEKTAGYKWQVAPQMAENKEATIQSFLQPTFTFFESELKSFEAEQTAIDPIHMINLPSLYEPHEDNVISWFDAS
jgi:hypothetical protein